MITKFGHRKIGRAQFELNKVQQSHKKKFGPRKFGARKAAIMAKELETAQAAVETPVVGIPDHSIDTSAATTSVKQMAIALNENVELLDEFIQLEQQRPAGTRKTAVKLFLGTEMGKEDDARPEVLTTLQGLLKGS